MGRGRDAGEQAGGRGLERRSKSGEEGGENGGERGAFLPPVNTLPFERWKRPARAYPSQFEKAGAGPKRRGRPPNLGLWEARGGVGGGGGSPKRRGIHLATKVGEEGCGEGRARACV